MDSNVVIPGRTRLRSQPGFQLARFVPALLLGGACLLFAENSQARTLSFEERVAAQEAIEQVYWNHRIWPSGNPGQKPPLSAVLSDEQIRARVRDYLEKSNALETLWQRPITRDQLQADMDRMAGNTHAPEMLRELYSALDNDPSLIAETLVRQTLADELIRKAYAEDVRFQGGLKQKAEAALAGCGSVACMNAMGGEYAEVTWTLRRFGGEAMRKEPGATRLLDDAEWRDYLGYLTRELGGAPMSLASRGMSRLAETADAFVSTAVLAQGKDSFTTATVMWRKTPFDAWWTGLQTKSSAAPAGSDATFRSAEVATSGCAYDAWGPPTSTSGNVPFARHAHTAVWTGTEMIVWGGTDIGGINATNTGGRYNPATDTWGAPTSTSGNVPSPRVTPSGVWTGTEMIVWGGDYLNRTNTGGRYNPASDTWGPSTSTSGNVPTARYWHTGVWTGTEMIVWGGLDLPNGIVNTGGRYNPVTNTWGTPISTTGNVPIARYAHAAVWTGTEMIVWGGEGPGDLNSGGRYNPATDAWGASTSTTGSIPSARSKHTAVWTTTEMIVWGGQTLVGQNSGGRYFPATDTWGAATSTSGNVPSARGLHSAVWTGTEMIVWGGTGFSSSDVNTGGRYCGCPAMSSIVSFSPAYGDYGSPVAIVGTGLDAVTSVQFNGVSASFTVNSSTSITATVPPGSAPGPIAILGGCGTVSSVDRFYPSGWSTCGVLVNGAVGDQLLPGMVSDGLGGVIVTSQDHRGSNNDIYVQRLTANGQPMWQADGVPVCTATGDQFNPAIASDGAGGAIVAWEDRRGGANGQLYVQRVDASGAALWPINGVALTSGSNGNRDAHILADGVGGAIVTWRDSISNSNSDIRAQRVNTSGLPQWTAGGIAVCAASGVQIGPAIASDGLGGAIIAWSDLRSPGASFDIYSQHVNAAGASQWMADGVAMCLMAGAQTNPQLVADGAGGAIVAWTDARAGGANPSAIYGQRVDGAGAPLWAANGVTLCTAPLGQTSPVIVADGAGGAIVAWQDNHAGTGYDILAQRVNSGGVLQWLATGVALGAATGNQLSPTIVSDGAGGAIVTWQDHRGADTDLYAQQVDATGAPRWTANGVALCTAAGDQTASAIAADSQGGAIVAWQDAKNGAGNSDIYAVRVRSNGLITSVPPATNQTSRSTLARPNPFTNEVSIDFALVMETPVRMEVFDAGGRRVRWSAAVVLGPGRHSLTWNGQGDDGSRQPAGIYFLRLRGRGIDESRRVVRMH